MAPSANPILASQLPIRRAGHAHQVLAGLLALCTTALAILLAILLGIWWRQPAYVMPFWVVLAGSVCAVLTGIGGALATRRGQTTSWLAPTVTLAALLGFLSAGTLVLLPVIVVLVLAANHRGKKAPATPPSRRPVSTGLILTLGLVPLCLFVLLRGPVVDCMSNGVDEGSPIWMWLGSLGSGTGIAGTGSSSSSDLDRTTGSVKAGGATYSFVCVGPKLAQFAKQ
ncbi:MAG TPA: hypothetical protein VND88_03095 [Candidatus Acidoferrales bacterium]|nr:hypothetical protein [Candidatus Acidoferrales bacterium]